VTALDEAVGEGIAEAAIRLGVGDDTPDTDANGHGVPGEEETPAEREPQRDALVEDREAPRQVPRHDHTEEREHDGVERGGATGAGS
jgi:hypothetical protein